MNEYDDDWVIYQGSRILRKDIDKIAYYDKYFERLAENVYQWKGEGLDFAYLEKLLYLDGMAVIFVHPTFGLKCGHVTQKSYNPEGKIRKCIPRLEYGTESDNTVYTDGKDCVIIYDTFSMLSRRNGIRKLDTITDIDDSVNVQIANQKFPLVAITDDSTLGHGSSKIIDKITYAMKDLYKNAKMLFIPSSVAGSIKPLNLNTTFNAIGLMQVQKSIINDNKEWLGIDSQDAVPKAERKIVSEQEGNDDTLMLFRDDGFKARKIGAKKCKDVLNLDIEPMLSLSTDETPSPEGTENDN